MPIDSRLTIPNGYKIVQRENAILNDDLPLIVNALELVYKNFEISQPASLN